MRSPARTLAAALVAAVLTCALAALPANASLESQLQTTMSAQALLKAAIKGDTAKITGYEGRVADLEKTLAGVQESLDIQEGELSRLKDRLRGSRSHLLELRRKEAHDRAALARQLRGQYKSDSPSIVNVVLSAHGFAELLDSVDAMRSVGRRNAKIVLAVTRARRATAREARRLRFLTNRQQAIATAALNQRDRVSRLRLSVVAAQMRFVHARDAKSSRLKSLTATATRLQHKIAANQAKIARQTGVTYGGGQSIGGDSGSYGFFQQAGTNYSVGDEPELARRLDALGKALHLHLLGISGYRTPQHSVEVGGFPNDPHTRGQASDTSGIEGVSEATLNQFGLHRPFPVPGEMNHIHLLGVQ